MSFVFSLKDISFLTIYRISIKEKIELFKPLHFVSFARQTIFEYEHQNCF